MRHFHIISRIAIYMLAVVLFIFGIFYFKYPHDMIVYVPVFLPFGIKWAYLLGSGFILVAVSYITNQYVKLTSYLLVLLLLFFIFAFHVPNYMNAGDPDMRQMALINILKDTAILGFALHIAAGAHHQHFHLEEAD